MAYLLAAVKACPPFDVHLLFAGIASCGTKSPSNEEVAVGNILELQVRAQEGAAAVEHIL
jgi:hypothetical protein